MFVISRSSHNPLISPNKDHGWEEISTCNGSVCIVDNTLHMVYRAMSMPDKLDAPDLYRSSIGYTMSTDGTHFGSRRQLLSPEAEWEKYGCEDPRITYFEGRYYIFYTALSEYPLNANGIKVAVGISDDLKTINERHLVTPFNAKAMALFPTRVDGKVTVIVSVDTDKPPTKIAIAQFDEIEDLWNLDLWQEWYKNIDKHCLNLSRGGNDHVEVGAAPVKTEHGWLLVYSHIQEYFGGGKPIFGIEAVLLHKKKPLTVVGRTGYPFIVPETVYERYGLIPNVTFPTGAAIYGENLDIYYGASDTTTCRATVKVKDILDSIRAETRMSLVTRSENNPLLEPVEDHEFESRDVFNPAAIELEGKAHILYRAMSKDNTSTIGYASSNDGEWINFRSKKPAYVPREQFEQKLGGPTGNSGCEDPRLTRIGDELYLCYTAYDGKNSPRVAMSHISVASFLARKWSAWAKPILLSPPGIDDKDACIVALPGQEKTRAYIFHRIESHICADIVLNLDFKSEGVKKCIEVLAPRRGMWDSLKVGIGAPPFLTEKGWLLIYHGVSNDKVYRAGAALLDKNDPTVVISRTVDPIFEPEEEWEKSGEIGNVVFPCGSILKGDDLFIYYGGADRVVGVAKASLKSLLERLTID